MDVMTRQEIEQKMDELAREHHDIHDPEIRKETYKLIEEIEYGPTIRVYKCTNQQEARFRQATSVQ
jgi:hypothetical protein